MYSKLVAAASVVSLVPFVAAQLDKPVIEPNFPDNGLGSLEQALSDNTTPAGSTHDDWEAGWIPQDCKTLAEGSGFSALDITTFNIHYDDCPDAWVFCRHKDSPLTEDSMVDVWGRLPVGMRSFVRHIIALPGTESAGSNGDNVQMNGDIGITVYVHETGHSLDSNAMDESLGRPFSTGTAWTDAYNADSAVTDPYAQSSQQENFAQMTVVALYDNVVPGGIASVQSNSQAIFNQYSTAQSYLGDIIVPGGTCTQRLENSEPVAQSTSAKFRRNLGPKPDVSLSDKVSVIKSTPMSSSMEMHSYNKAGKMVSTKAMTLDLQGVRS